MNKLDSFLDRGDMSVLFIAMMARCIKDASGPNPLDSITSEKDMNEAREFLTRGIIERFGYYQYRQFKPVKRNSLDEKFYKFVKTRTLQKGNVSVQHILDLFGVDYSFFSDKISLWRDSGWSREHPFYQGFLNFAKVIKF